MYSVKEELKKKDQEILEKAVSYQKTLEQLEALKLAHNEVFIIITIVIIFIISSFSSFSLLSLLS